MPDFDQKTNADLVPLIKECGLDPAKMKFWDNKVNWKEGVTKADLYVKSVQKEQPSELFALGGIDPTLRTEVNFKIVNNKPAVMAFKGKKICRFVFAFPAKDEKDATVSPALKKLGWLPASGQFKHQYLIKIPSGTHFACDGGDFKPADSMKEVAFPDTIPYGWIVSALKVDSTGKGTDAPLGPFKGTPGKAKSMLT